MTEPFPRPPENEDVLEALVAEVTDEYLERVERGERPNPDEYRQRYPQIADVLREVLPALEAMRTSGLSNSRPRTVPEAGPPLGSLGDFRLLREVGRGGMGIVYEAEQISLGRRVALKVLPFAAALDPKRLERFRHEAQAAAHLHHSHIVPVFAVGCERGVYYYAMQFIEGQSLAEVIAQLRRRSEPDEPPSVPLSLQPSQILSAEKSQDPSLLMFGSQAMPKTSPWSQESPADVAAHETNPQVSSSTLYAAQGQAFINMVVHWGIQAAEALEHAHSLGIVHRDIKPANLLIDVREHLWVTDFGLAQHCNDAGLTATGDLVGTLRYMSPEQALGERGRIDHRTDIYSLAATLYELLTLQPLLHGRNREELLRQVIAEAPVSLRRLNRAVPSDLETILLKALAKEPAERYGSAGELAGDLQRYLAHEPIRAKRPSPLERASKWARRHRSVALSGLAMLLVTVVALAVSTALVVREQAKTQAALDRRERDFQQAREMLDTFTQVCENELNEDNEARTKLLQAASDYYSQFIEQSADDPTLRSELTNSHLHLAAILSQSGSPEAAMDNLERARTLMEEQVRKNPNIPAFRRALFDIYLQIGLSQGEALAMAASLEKVQRHLKLSAEQVAAIKHLVEESRGRLAVLRENRDPIEARHRIEVEAAKAQGPLSAILTAEQRARLEQIALQFRGVRAFNEPSVVEALQLSETQQAAIQKIQAESQEAWRERRRGGDDAQSLKSWEERVRGVLTPEQQAQWQTMLGEKFELGHVPFGVWGGPRQGPPKPPHREERSPREEPLSDSE